MGNTQEEQPQRETIKGLTLGNAWTKITDAIKNRNTYVLVPQNPEGNVLTFYHPYQHVEDNEEPIIHMLVRTAQDPDGCIIFRRSPQPTSRKKEGVLISLRKPPISDSSILFTYNIGHVTT